MAALRLVQTGEYDADFEAAVSPEGAYRVEGGSYVTRGVREGALSREAHARLVALAEAVLLVPEDRPHEEAPGFATTLSAGDRTVRWWGPPPTEAHRDLIGALAGLGA